MIINKTPHLTLEQERALVGRAHAGESRATHKLLEAHYAQMYHVALKTCRDAILAEDITQEACVQVLRRIDQFRGESRFSSWVARIVLNAVLLRHRKERRMMPMEDLAPLLGVDEDPTPEERLESRQLLEVVDEALGELRDGDRELFMKRFIDDRSLQSLSEETGLSLPALKSRFHRARQRLKSKSIDERWGVQFGEEVGVGA
jgi:RNA polymerase sigma-70 factor (ECF subfamily)